MKGLLMRAVESGQVLEMIYMDNKGNLSQRMVKVSSINKESFRAYCYTRKQQRLFKISNVLSIGPVRTRKTAS